MFGYLFWREVRSLRAAEILWAELWPFPVLGGLGALQLLIVANRERTGPQFLAVGSDGIAVGRANGADNLWHWPEVSAVRITRSSGWLTVEHQRGRFQVWYRFLGMGQDDINRFEIAVAQFAPPEIGKSMR